VSTPLQSTIYVKRVGRLNELGKTVHYCTVIENNTVRNRKNILYASKRTYGDLRLLPPTDDNTNVALGVHNAYTHPLLQENRTLSRLRIHFDRILHQKKGKENLQLPLSEMSTRKQKKVSNTYIRCSLDIFLPSLAHRNSTPERHGVVHHQFSVLRELLLRHIPRRDILFRSLVDLRVQMYSSRRTHDFISPVECIPSQFGRLHNGPDRHDGSCKTKGLLDRRVQ